MSSPSNDLELITAPQSEAAGAAGSATVRGTQPLSADDQRKVAAGKRRAASLDPAIAAQQADDLEELSGPENLSHTINVTFPGLNFVTSQHNGNGKLAPDTSVAASGTRVLEATQFALRLFSPTGNVVDTKSLNTFFSASDATYGLVTDPKVYFDRNSPNRRFFIVAVSRTLSGTKVSRVWIAVSRGVGPASLSSSEWCRYQTNGRMNSGGSLDSYAGPPRIGFGADAMVISVDNLTWSVSNFTYAFIRTFRKLALENNAGACPSGGSGAMHTFKASTINLNDNARSLQPVQHYSSPSSFSGVTNPVYLLATVPFGFTNVIRVWRVANVAGTPTFVGPYALANGLSYDVPPNSPQLGSSDLLNTHENEITQAAGLGDTLHGVFPTVCNLGGGATEACIRYVRIGISGPSLSGAYQQQITFGRMDNFFWAPGVAVNLVGKVLVVFQRASSTQYLKTGYTGKTASATIFEVPNTMPNGTCALAFGNPGWTSAFVGAQTDSGGTSFWLAGERASPISPDTTCWWETDVRRVTPP